MSTRADASLEQVLAAAGARFAYLFGSRASGQARADSDADIAVMPTRELGLRAQARLAQGLARALAVPDLDLVLLDRATLELRGHIVQTGRLLFSADEPARVAFEVRTRSEYLDFLPTLKALERAYLAQVARHGL
ncbi:MAG: nucleotidyltransferase domain-containing protein [Solirubrobacterales bacterium]|nr:MAG: nucleotidyltransferase domain-containing protein [Solirubrobacterales bacterium]